MVSAFASEVRLTLAQVKVDKKSNEITAIPELLDMLLIKGAIVTIDAIGCQKNIVSQIVEKGGDYIIALKKNQGNLYEQVDDFYTLEAKDGFKDVDYDYHKDLDKGHGRIEARECWAVSNIKWIKDVDKWKGLNTIIMIRSKRIVNEKETTETRYYISSLPPNASLINKSIRKHWSIENSLHWVLDVVMGEDGSRIRAKNGAEIVTAQ